MKKIIHSSISNKLFSLIRSYTSVKMYDRSKDSELFALLILFSLEKKEN